MRHIIITRYNLGKADSVDFDMDKTNPNRKKPYVGLDPDRLEYRFKLFENYLIPALKAQTNQYFDFVLRMHKDTPKEYIDRLEKLYPETIFCYSKDPLEHLGDYNGPVITTRIDSDDCVSKYYVEDIQNAVRNGEKQLIIPSKGVDIHWVKNQFVYCDVPVKRGHTYSNPFISFYESKAPYDTVLKYTHHTMGLNYPHVYADTRPLWMRIMHGRNVANDTVLDHKKLTKELLEGYDFLPNIDEIYAAMNRYNDSPKG